MMTMYKRYRQWAAQFGQKDIMLIGAASGAIGYIVLIFLGKKLTLSILPWVTLIATPLAAFDAWGAATHRGAPREGILRALVILALFWGLTGFLFFII
jgi:hypothetical protein